MKTLPPALAAHLASGATTLCWCWRISPRAGTALGFTDHDCDLAFDGTTFEAASGFTATDMRSSVGLSVDNLEVDGALSSDSLSETALSAGDFDDAAIEIFRVNWQDTSQRVLMRRGSLGQVRRSGASFAAEVRGLAHYLNQPQGRVHQYSCDAELGDRRCGIDTSGPAYRATATVLASLDDRRFSSAGLGQYAAGWLTRGLVTFTSGANAGRSIEIKRHSLDAAGNALLELWQPPGAPPVAGDAFTVTAGCDKHLATCTAKFANATNYRGFPHMPGNDFLASPITG